MHITLGRAPPRLCSGAWGQMYAIFRRREVPRESAERRILAFSRVPVVVLAAGHRNAALLYER